MFATTASSNLKARIDGSAYDGLSLYPKAECRQSLHLSIALRENDNRYRHAKTVPEPRFRSSPITLRLAPAWGEREFRETPDGNEIASLIRHFLERELTSER